MGVTKLRKASHIFDLEITYELSFSCARSFKVNFDLEKFRLTHLRPMFHLYTPWKLQFRKPDGFSGWVNENERSFLWKLNSYMFQYRIYFKVNNVSFKRILPFNPIFWFCSAYESAVTVILEF